MLSVPIVTIQALANRFGDHWVHKDLTLSIESREIVAVIGPSGCGKSTLMRSILMLQKPYAGDVNVFGIDVIRASDSLKQSVRKRWGVMFQSGALFSSLTVLENVMFLLKEHTNMPDALQRQLALSKIILSGLGVEVAYQYPNELSGGMRKRAALARAMIMDPELVFLDEPTAGLDPKGAMEMNQLIVYLRDSLDMTFFIITHDFNTLWHVPDRVIFLEDRRVLAAMPMRELVNVSDPLIVDYFSGLSEQERSSPSLFSKDQYGS